MTSRIDRSLVPSLRRRDVLAFGAGLVAAPAIAWSETQDQQCAELAIGFCGKASDDVTTASMVPADHLTAGDPRLSQGDVRLTVEGLLGNLELLPSLGVRSAELKVGFRISGAELSDVEFRAWSYQLLPQPEFSSPVSFNMPAADGLSLALEVETLTAERFETKLVMGRDSGTPKLRPGRYLIAPGSLDLSPQLFDAALSPPMIALTVEPLA